MRTLLLVGVALVFAALGCQTKTQTTKSPEPAPMAEQDSTADQGEADPWTSSDTAATEEEDTVAEPTNEEEVEPEPVYDEYGGDEEPPADEESGDYDESEG